MVEDHSRVRMCGATSRILWLAVQRESVCMYQAVVVERYSSAAAQDVEVGANAVFQIRVTNHIVCDHVITPSGTGSCAVVVLLWCATCSATAGGLQCSAGNQQQ